MANLPPAETENDWRTRQDGGTTVLEIRSIHGDNVGRGHDLIIKWQSLQTWCAWQTFLNLFIYLTFVTRATLGYPIPPEALEQRRKRHRHGKTHDSLCQRRQHRARRFTSDDYSETWRSCGWALLCLCYVKLHGNSLHRNFKSMQKRCKIWVQTLSCKSRSITLTQDGRANLARFTQLWEASIKPVQNANLGSVYCSDRSKVTKTIYSRTKALRYQQRTGTGCQRHWWRWMREGKS